MKIAVTYENGQVYQHFGHTEQFKFYEAEGLQVVKAEIVDVKGRGHGTLADFLARRGVEVLICGGIGPGAQNTLAESGIRLYGGVTGAVDEAVKALLENRLTYDPAVHCTHHGEDHTCGHGGSEHGCSGGGCGRH